MPRSNAQTVRNPDADERPSWHLVTTHQGGPSDDAGNRYDICLLQSSIELVAEFELASRRQNGERMLRKPMFACMHNPAVTANGVILRDPVPRAERDRFNNPYKTIVPFFEVPRDVKTADEFTQSYGIRFAKVNSKDFGYFETQRTICIFPRNVWANRKGKYGG